MSTSKRCLVKRPWTSKDENGSTIEHAGWTEIGIAHPPKSGGAGLNLFLLAQPLITNDPKKGPRVETLYLYDFEPKQQPQQENNNGPI